MTTTHEPQDTCTIMDAFISAYIILEIQDQLKPLIIDSMTNTLSLIKKMYKNRI